VSALYAFRGVEGRGARTARILFFLFLVLAILMLFF